MTSIHTAPAHRAKPLFWNGTLVRSRFFDALSLILPAGEAFLIDTLEAWRTRCSAPIDTKLRSEVERFVREERVHRQAHVRYNDALIAGLPDARAVADRANRVTAELEQLDFPMKIALVAAFEHLTAVLSEEVVSHGTLLIDGQSHATRLWRWHAREELGHRDVAIDVAARAGLRRGTLRLALLLATGYLLVDQLRYTFALCRCDIRSGALSRRAASIDAARFVFGSMPSLVRMARGWWRYFRAPLNVAR
ncbi:metal-dependent hydrolase [Paraburkholderia sp. NMBU_R16]|uniref:metal-dependent hydrolase n=1 Tax=Paraburkholderia sp. NMBU_R16 TaxID=2698676 RepID=UPI00156672FA|nr:metal-dependent hydrolase [Paraburkholderia sp. NMBU_R16]NRO95738.1 metal-dependent hydrolase [Paraburkholderia sp. NMBU_R16]